MKTVGRIDHRIKGNLIVLTPMPHKRKPREQIDLRGVGGGRYQRHHELGIVDFLTRKESWRVLQVHQNYIRLEEAEPAKSRCDGTGDTLRIVQIPVIDFVRSDLPD